MGLGDDGSVALGLDSFPPDCLWVRSELPSSAGSWLCVLLVSHSPPLPFRTFKRLWKQVSENLDRYRTFPRLAGGTCPDLAIRGLPAVCSPGSDMSSKESGSSDPSAPNSELQRGSSYQTCTEECGGHSTSHSEGLAVRTPGFLFLTLEDTWSRVQSRRRKAGTPGLCPPYS